MKTCERCGISDHSIGIHVHHVCGRVGKDKDKPENLIQLCVTCHMMWHQHRDTDYEDWMYQTMKDRWGDKFPVKVNGYPNMTKWIMAAERRANDGPSTPDDVQTE